jgi:hypothetical protein
MRPVADAVISRRSLCESCDLRELQTFSAMQVGLGFRALAGGPPDRHKQDSAQHMRAPIDAREF